MKQRFSIQKIKTCEKKDAYGGPYGHFQKSELGGIDD